MVPVLVVVETVAVEEPVLLDVLCLEVDEAEETVEPVAVEDGEDKKPGVVVDRVEGVDRVEVEVDEKLLTLAGDVEKLVDVVGGLSGRRALTTFADNKRISHFGRPMRRHDD